MRGIRTLEKSIQEIFLKFVSSFEIGLDNMILSCQSLLVNVWDHGYLFCTNSLIHTYLIGEVKRETQRSV